MADGNGGLIPPRRGFTVYDTTTGEPERYIPLPDAQSEAYRERVRAIWADYMGRWKHG